MVSPAAHWPAAIDIIGETATNSALERLNRLTSQSGSQAIGTASPSLSDLSAALLCTALQGAVASAGLLGNMEQCRTTWDEWSQTRAEKPDSPDHCFAAEHASVDSSRPRHRTQGSKSARSVTTQSALAAVCTLAIVASLSAVTGAETSFATTATTTTVAAGCGGVERCLANTHCAQCLQAINSTAPRTKADYIGLNLTARKANDVNFFRALQSTASCSTSVTMQGILYPALQELNTMLSCMLEYRMVMSYCAVPAYTCFADPNCGQCVGAVYAATEGISGTKAVAMGSSACIATDTAMLILFSNQCASFPKCTFYKARCASLPECASCLATLGAGDGAEAAQQCPTSTQPSAFSLDNVVYHCIGSTFEACDFWHQRCADNANCSACLADMGNGDNARAIAAEWSSPFCRSALQDSVAVGFLVDLTSGCPGIGACRVAVSNCVLDHGDVCIACVNGSAASSQAASCAQLFQDFHIESACQPCRSSVHTINAVTYATAAVGGVSTATCVAVATTIVAHGRDRVCMRDRIIVGLMLANAVYSTANTIPLNALLTGTLDCGRLFMSFDAIRFGRAWWFFGKFGLVGFELFILGASIRALHSGMSGMPLRVEAMLHAACCILAVAAFAVFYALCADINADGYNKSAEDEEYANAFDHGSVNDDIDDYMPSMAASSKFRTGRAEYVDLIRDMLEVWDAFAGMTMGLWAVLRVLYWHALRALRTEATAVARAEASDTWISTRRSAWETRRRLLEARREAFNDVAKPLEPYIAVFVLFAVPTFLMSTSFCLTHSGARAGGNSGTVVGGEGLLTGRVTTDVTYGTCDVWCEFVLAFRSLGTVAVYLLSREHRAELFGVRTTWRKICARVAGCVRCTSSQYALLDHDSGEWYEMHKLLQPAADDDNNKNTSANSIVPTVASNTPRLIAESDIEKVRVLGRGGFGEVWEGTLQPDGQKVAIKIMLAAVVDDDGDIIDPFADEDFGKECDALQRIDSPHLLKFFGFGTSSGGNRFIVTELLAGGSLLDALRDSRRDLPWRTRTKIALQVALGMKHLHEKHMLHRDLKSANVLLDEQLRAKVCDFGLSRVFRPARQRVLHSPFTGVTRLLPHQADDVEINDRRQPILSLENVAVSVLDAHGTMTKAAGTLLWMAPEVYRGDRNYTGAVDVFSYGIMMWELATRKKPWVDELSHETLFFEQLNSALQTGRRPAIPETVKAERGEFVAVMQRCWAGDPNDRPTFAEVSNDLFFLLFN
jgi:hypothetical protein